MSEKNSNIKENEYKIAIIIGVIIAIIIVIISIVARTGDSVALTINDTEIMESTITRHINQFRKENNLTSDQAWHDFLEEEDIDAEFMRDSAISSELDYYVYQKMAAEYGVSVSDEEIQDIYDDAYRAYVHDPNDPDAFQQFLYKNHITQEMYKRSIYNELVRDKIGIIVFGETEEQPSEEDRLKIINDNIERIIGIKYYVAVVADTLYLAESAYAEIESGSDPEYVQQRYMMSDAEHYRGWGNVPLVFEEDVDQQISALGVGEYTDILQLKEQTSYAIVTCTKEIEAPPTGKFTSLSEIPSEIADGYSAESIANNTRSDEVTALRDDFTSGWTVIIEPMPEGLSYAK